MPHWEEATGGKINVAEIPIETLHQQIFSDLSSGLGKYDAYMPACWFYGDIFVPETPYIVPIEPFLKDPKHSYWDPSQWIPSSGKLFHWNGVLYGALLDGDCQALYYRKDVFARKDVQDRFKAKYNSAPFDLVSVALSKGLGCPVGSVLAGRRDDIARAHRARRMFGGAMRQAGILAAAGLWALDHNLDRLVDDHVNARLIAERLAELPGVELDLATVQSNIVIFHMAPGTADAATIVAGAAEAGVLVSAFAARTVRAVTHLDVSRDDCRRAADRLVAVIG